MPATLGAGGGTNVAHASTPYRRVDAQFDVPEYSLARPSWGMGRRGDQIAVAAQSGFGASTNVALLPSGTWCLRPLQMGWDWELVDAGTPIITLLSVLAASYIENKYLQAPPPMPGITVGAGGQTSSFNSFFFKRVPADYSFSSTPGGLPGDLVAVHPPTTDSIIPMDRVISGAETFIENVGWCLRFYVPSTQTQTHLVIANFYFGGDTDVYPPVLPGTTSQNYGGMFCCSFLSSGVAELREYGRYNAGVREWVKVFEFRYCPHGQVEGQLHTVMFIPHRGDKMDIICEVSGESHPRGPTTGPRKMSIGHSTTTAVYHHNAQVTGVTAKRAMVGPGPIRMDVRQDLRLLFQPSYLWFPESGQVVDHAFTIPFPLTTTDKIFPNLSAMLPPGTNVSGTLHDARTYAALTLNSDGSYQPVPNQTQYFARFQMTTTDRRLSPFLYDFHAYVPGKASERSTTPFTSQAAGAAGGIVRHVSITGPSADPTHETASFTLDDILNSVPRMRYRGRYHTRLRTSWDPNDATKKCVLIEGEIPRATAHRYGHTGRTYPNPQARMYDCPMVAMWSRLADQLWFGKMQPFNEDPAAPPDPSLGNQRPPWKITSILRTIFSEGLGIPDDMLDIPDLDVRAFPSGTDPMEFSLQPTASIVEYLLRLVRDYLGYYLIWDANATGDVAKKRGMWRVLPPPLPPYTTLWSFQTTHPGSGKLPHVPQSYASRTSPAWDYHAWVEPPEANYVVVTTVGELLPGKNSNVAYTQYAYNKHSFSFDPSSPTATDPDHPDFLGRFVPIIYYNAHLSGSTAEQTQYITSVICRRLFNQTCFARKWIRFTAPLALASDTSDAYLTIGNGVRPLRYYDVIGFDGSQFLVHNVEMKVDEDHHQSMTCECVAVDNTLVA